MMACAVCAALALTLLVLPSITAAQSGGLTWTRVAQNGDRPDPRNWFAFGHDPLSNSLIVFSGVTANETEMNDTWIFNIADGTWTEVSPSSAPAGRADSYYGVLRVNGESLFVVTHGFWDSELDDVWAFRFSTNEWTEIKPTGRSPGRRYGGHFGAAYGDSNVLWVGGGFTAEAGLLPIRYIDTYKLEFTDFTTATWEEVFPQPSVGNQFLPFQPHGRCLQTSAIVGQMGLVIAGGCMT